MSFAGIAIRKNGPDQKIDMDWFNALRAAGNALEELVAGPVVIPEVPIDIANNQGAPANVPGLTLDAVKTHGAFVTAEIRRKTATNEKISIRQFALIFSEKDSVWSLDPGGYMGADAGVTLSIIPGSGQVQYVSDNLVGANYVGKMRFKVTTFGV